MDKQSIPEMGRDFSSEHLLTLEAMSINPRELRIAPPQHVLRKRQLDSMAPDFQENKLDRYPPVEILVIKAEELRSIFEKKEVPLEQMRAFFSIHTSEDVYVSMDGNNRLVSAFSYNRNLYSVFIPYDSTTEKVQYSTTVYGHEYSVTVDYQQIAVTMLASTVRMGIYTIKDLVEHATKV